MRKLYAFCMTAFVLLGFLSQNVKAQTYTPASYLVRTQAATWEDASGGTTVASLMTSLYYDYWSISEELTLPFNFRLADRVSNKIKITSMGTVVLGGSSNVPDNVTYCYMYYNYYNMYYPNIYGGNYQYGAYYNIIANAGYFCQTPTFGIKYATIGSPGNRKYIVECDNKTSYPGYFNGNVPLGSWQVVLYEAGISTMQFNYQTAVGNPGNQWYDYGTGTGTGFITHGGCGGELSLFTGSNGAPGSTPSFTTCGYYDNEYYALPTVSYRIFIAYPYDMSADAITSPANQSIILKDLAVDVTGIISNQGSSQPSGTTVRRQIWRVGDPTPVYTNDLVLSGGSIPLSFNSANVSWPQFTPTQYGIYEDSMFIVSVSPTADQYTANNLAVSEFTVSPPNNIKAITVLNPAPNSRTPINISTPIGIRFKNIGANGQINVPVTAIVKDPNGNVIYRDTAIIKNWPSGVTYDTLFREYTPTSNGNYTVCGIAIMITDQLKADDTTCASALVRFEADVAATGNFNPQPDEEKPYTRVFKPTGIFQSVGVSDLFDVPARVEIRRCSDGALVFRADSTIPELNVDAGKVKFGFPTKQGNFDISKITPGCYTQCVFSRYSTDGDRSNDTACTTFSIIDRLKGNIEVGVGRRFQTLTAARDSAVFRGIGANVNLILTDASYTENGTTDASSQFAALDFSGILGTADTAVLKFMPKAGVNPVITFTGNKPYCMYFGSRGPNYVTFDGMNQLSPTPELYRADVSKRGMTFINNSTAAGSVIACEFGKHHMTFKNLKLVNNGIYGNDSSAVIRLYNEATRSSFLGGVTDTTPNHDIRIENNELGNAKYGVKELGLQPLFSLGPAVFFDRRDYNNWIGRNTIGSSTNPIGFGGIGFDNAQDLSLLRNDIQWVNGSLAGVSYVAGIGQLGVGNVTNVWVDGNKIHNIWASQTIGIAFQQSATIYTNGTGVNQARSTLPGTTRNRVTDNMMYDLRGANSCYPVVFQTFSSTYFTDRDSVFNNSISVANANADIYMTQSGHPFLWNNLIQNMNIGGANYTNYYLSVPRTFVPRLSMDNNLFDLRGANRTFATVNEYDQTTGNFIQTRSFRRINDWRTYTQQDIHSVSGDPSLTTDSLHLPNALSYIVSPASNNGAWLNTASQYTDFDGETRLSGNQTPDIGADEFEGFQLNQDIGVLTITRPGGYSATSDTTLVTTENPMAIQAIVKNFGAQLAINRVVTAKLEVAISGGAYTQVASSTQTVTLDVNESRTIDFSAVTITPAQVANGVFRLTVSADNDQNNANNVQQKIFRLLVKNNATLVNFESTTAKGLQNRDSVTAGLRRLGVAYDSLDRSAYASIDLDLTPWWTIVWSSGDPTSSISGTNSLGGVSFKATEELERFLNAGQTYAKKSLVMAGQNIALYNDASNINGNGITDTNFTRSFIHVRYINNTPVVGGITNATLRGQQVYFTFGDNVTAVSPDVVAKAQITGPVGNDVSGISYTYPSHPTSPLDSAAGTTWHGSTYNVVFYAFDWADAIQTNPSEAGINTSGTTRFLRGALDFVTSFRGTILPVEFVDVKATAAASSNNITWEVARQKDVASYAIETLTGADWQQVGTVKATAATSYIFADQNVQAGASYTYRVVSVDLSGVRTESKTVNVSRALPVDFTLGQNYPNPFNPTTTIAYNLPSNATVTLKVIDVTGKVVRTELSADAQTAGDHSYLFNANDLSSGTYVYELTATQPNGQSIVLSKKMTLKK
jgi:hypothetical protein